MQVACLLPDFMRRCVHAGLSGWHLLQLEELQKVKIPTSIKVTPTRGGLLDNWD